MTPPCPMGNALTYPPIVRLRGGAAGRGGRAKNKIGPDRRLAANESVRCAVVSAGFVVSSVWWRAEHFGVPSGKIPAAWAARSPVPAPVVAVPVSLAAAAAAAWVAGAASGAAWARLAPGRRR